VTSPGKLSRFKKGESGNPGGRPKSKELRDLCREYTAAAVKRLGELAQNAKSPTVQIMAIRELLDRGYGRPMQALEVAIEDNRPEQEQTRRLAPQEVVAALSELITNAEKEMGLEPVTNFTNQERIHRLLQQPGPMPPALYAALHQASGTLQ